MDEIEKDLQTIDEIIIDLYIQKQTLEILFEQIEQEYGV